RWTAWTASRRSPSSASRRACASAPRSRTSTPAARRRSPSRRRGSPRSRPAGSASASARAPSPSSRRGTAAPSPVPRPARARPPGAVQTTARLLVKADPPGPAAETAVRRHVTAYLNVPVYRAFHESLGRAAALGPMWDAWERGDRKGAVAAVPEKVIDDLIIRGSTDEIRAHVRRYLAAGIDTAFLALSTAEPDPVRQLEPVLGAVRALTPSPR